MRIQEDDNKASLMKRPWIERTDSRTNLVDEKVHIAEASACCGPQGTNGCGYESQLEAMYQALQLAKDP